MLKTIWKYKLNPSQLVVDIPKGGEVLTVDSQNNEICLWVMVDPSGERESREFNVYGTGHPVHNAERQKYLGAAMLEGGDLVLHVFENI